MTNLEEKIKKEISSARPIPKWESASFYILKDVGIILLWLVSIFLVGLIINIMIRFHHWENIFIDHRFFAPALLSFPFELVILLIFLIVIQYFFIRKVHFIYRLPKAIIIAVIIIALSLGFILAQGVGLNLFLSQKPAIKGIYRNEGRFFGRGALVINGEVVEVQDDKLKIKDNFGRVTEIKINEQTRKIGETNYEIGNFVRVMMARGQDNMALTICNLAEDFFGCRGQMKPPMY